MNPAEAHSLVRVALINPEKAREIGRAVWDEFRELLPGILTTTGSYLLTDFLSKRLGLREPEKPKPQDFLTMIQQAPVVEKSAADLRAIVAGLAEPFTTKGRKAMAHRRLRNKILGQLLKHEDSGLRSIGERAYYALKLKGEVL